MQQAKKTIASQISSHLPPEIIGNIFYHLRHDAYTLYQTSTCSRMFRDEAERVLYTSIVISHSDRLPELLFALTATPNNQGLRRWLTVKHLLLKPKFRGVTLRNGSDHETDIRAVLQLLDNLVELGLFTSPGVGPYPFQLQSLSSDDATVAYHLFDLLGSQPSIRSLAVELSWMTIPEMSNPPTPFMLPNLTVFSGILAHSLHYVVGRPVLSLSLQTFSLSTSTDVTRLKWLISKLPTPITSLTIMEINFSEHIFVELGESIPRLEYLGLLRMDQVTLDHPESWSKALSPLKNLTSISCRVPTMRERFNALRVAHIRIMAPVASQACHVHCPSLQQITISIPPLVENNLDPMVEVDCHTRSGVWTVTRVGQLFAW
ncbi:hypothetical protein FRB94_014719 [Tulasnella sp. JGI-2019a]|nr:hypothetical protein FRB94_014719 [Tulasnella sp. JGI-2019a]